jgi:hypothetical protein
MTLAFELLEVEEPDKIKGLGYQLIQNELDWSKYIEQ